MGSDDTDKNCDDEEDSTWGMCKTISLVMNYLTSLKAMSNLLYDRFSNPTGCFRITVKSKTHRTGPLFNLK